MDLNEWCAYTERGRSSEIVLKWATGSMTVNFLEFITANRYTQTPVKKLLRLTNTENRKIMLQTIKVELHYISEIQIKYKNKHTAQIQTIANDTTLDCKQKEKAIKKENRMYAMTCKEYNTDQAKLMKLQEIILQAQNK